MTQFKVTKNYTVKYSVVCIEALNSYDGGSTIDTEKAGLNLQEAVFLKEYKDLLNTNDEVDYMITADVIIKDKSK